MKYQLFVTVLILTFFQITAVQAERVKDIATVAGVRSNQLIGYGLVIGLDGTGDQTNQATFTLQSFKSMLKRLGIMLPASAKPGLKNVAAVVVTATLPPFSKPGQHIDITVSSIANAKSLRGGTLLLTPLKGANNKVYAVAQGSVIVSGFSVRGEDGSSITHNVPSTGRIPNGAIVERAVRTPFLHSDLITLNLNSPDFTTANTLANQINKTLGGRTAKAIDAASIQINAPINHVQRVKLLSIIENIEIKPANAKAKIVINSRSGTIIIGQYVRVGTAAITHGSLTLTVTENPTVSQPGPLSGPGATTAIVNNSNLSANQERNPMFLFGPGASLQDIVRAVNRVGATPTDLIAILDALRRVGALHADVEVI